MNGSCNTYEWAMSYVMSHVRMMHVTHVSESCHTLWMSHFTRTNGSCDTRETCDRVESYLWVMSHTMNESCHTYEWVKWHIWNMWSSWAMSHIWMSYVVHTNESCHTCEWVMPHTMKESFHTYEWVKWHTWYMWSSWAMSHVRMRHVSLIRHINDSLICHINDSLPHVWTNHVIWPRMMHATHINDYRSLLQKSPVKKTIFCKRNLWMSHVTRSNDVCYTYQWVIATRMNESCHMTAYFHSCVRHGFLFYFK